jgi:hypothetical protein
LRTSGTVHAPTIWGVPPTTHGVITEYFGNLREPSGSHPDHVERGVPMYGIGELASRLGLPPRRIRRWIRTGVFPETPHWIEGTDRFSHRRRYTPAMLDAAERVARQLGLLGKRRWDLESDFGDLVSDAWFQSEHDHVDPTFEWCGIRGWDANPRSITDYTTPDALRRAELARLPTPVNRDDRVIDMTTPEARAANNRGAPIYVPPKRT